jgi:hypothetical protein
MNSEDSDNESFDYDSFSELDSFNLKCKNIDPNLAKLMNIIIDKNDSEDKIDWRPPEKSGLSNSEPIIKNKQNIDNEQFNKLKDDIKYFRKLTDEQLEFIKNLDNSKKLEIIQIYQNCLNYIIHK